MATVITVVGVTALIYEVLERDYGVPKPGGSLGSGITTTAGLSQAQVEAIVNQAIANLPAGGAGGVTQAQVDAAIAAAIAAAPAGISQAQVEALIEARLSRPLDGPLTVSPSVTAGVVGDTAEIIAAHPDNKPVNLELSAPGGQVTANGQKVLNEVEIRDAVAGWLKVSPEIGSPRITDARVGTLWSAGGEGRVAEFKNVDGSTWLRISNGQNGPEIGTVAASGSVLDSDIRIRPYGRGALVIGTAGATATVRADGDLNDVDLALEARGDGKVKVDNSPVVTEDYLAGIVGPAIQQAVASQVNKINDRLTLNSSTADDKSVVVETNNLTGAQHKVGIDFVTQRDGQVTVNGKRVLTVDDALDPSGVDAAAVEAVVAPLAEALNDKADKTELQQVGSDIVDWVSTTFSEKEVVDNLFRKFSDNASASPDEALEEFFVLLNDIIGKLLDATGVVPRAGKMQPTDAGANRVAALEDEVARLLAAGGVLPSGECATKVDLNEYVKKSDLVNPPVPVPDNVKIATPVVGEGASLITPSNVMNLRYMHTPGPDDNFLLVFVSYMIPNVVPGGSVWNIKVTYGGKPVTFFQEYNSASVAADRTRGTIQGYWLSITPDPTQTPQEVVITCTTGMDLTGKAGDPTYAFRSNSVTMGNRTSSSHVGGDNAGAASINVAGPAGFNRRWIGFTHVPTTPSRTFVNTVNGPAKVLWEVDDNGGRRALIYTTTDEHVILHGGQPANAYASAHLAVNVVAPPKVT